LTFKNPAVSSDRGAPITPQTKLSPVGLKNPERTLTDAGGEYDYKNSEWIKFIEQRNAQVPEKQKCYKEVWYTGKMNMLLFSMKDGVIYLRGHCMPNQSYLESGGSKLDYKEVADRLFDSGIDSEFAGKIKCYNCHSGEGGDQSFLALFSQYMYKKKGLTRCTYWGYDGALDSMAGQSGPHKTTKLDSGKSERAKLHQIQYHPV
jgi:hypothetical protein